MVVDSDGHFFFWAEQWERILEYPWGTTDTIQTRSNAGGAIR